MSEDYSNYPKSITELKSDKTQQANDWTPRDVLIDMLRKIDNGEVKPNILAICFREDADTPRISLSSPDPLITTGMLAHIIGSRIC
jgi:hypothetical protein